jgi:hypothetical protein
MEQMRDRAREFLLIGGVALLFAATQIRPVDLGVMRFLTMIAIGAVWTMTAALSPDPR